LISSRIVLIAVIAMLHHGCGGDTKDTAFEIANQAPISVAGGNQSVTVDSSVILDGSASRDPNGDPLSYRWSLTAKPNGSSASLSLHSSAKPSFIADLAGTYVATLIVNDGKIDGAPSTVSVTASAANAAPVANAGNTQNVITGSTVNLDGTSSQDANGDPLSYRWSLSAKPSGSNASLSLSTTAKPSFIADLAGTYLATLIVNDGNIDSASNTVSVTASAANAAPVANAGSAQSVTTGSTVNLDGSASRDANGDALSYRWSLTAKPSGSGASLSLSTTAKPSFIADLAGTYVATLIVNDGKIDSASTTVAVTADRVNVKGVAYLASNGITVTLTALNISDLPNGTKRYTVTYRQQNNTASAIDEGSVKLYFTDAAPLRQFGFFNRVLPGPESALTRTYSWDVPASSTPLLLQYHEDQFSANAPISGALQWLFPIR